MPTYLDKKLDYGLFVRDHNQIRFEDISKPDAFVCWIDLLGFKNFSHADIVKIIKRVLLATSESSAVGPIRNVGNPGFPLLIGTPQTAIQYSIIGDAIVLTEKEQVGTQSAATLGLIYRANLLSTFLFEEDILHRGVITRGPVHCEKFDDIAIITGKAIVNAYNLEKALKVSGLFYDINTFNFITSRQSQIDTHSFCEPFSSLPSWAAAQHAPDLAGISFSQYGGWQSWVKAMNSAIQSYETIQNALDLISILKNKYNLP